MSQHKAKTYLIIGFSLSFLPNDTNNNLFFFKLYYACIIFYEKQFKVSFYYLYWYPN